jgi:hypothetical protein
MRTKREQNTGLVNGSAVTLPIIKGTHMAKPAADTHEFDPTAPLEIEVQEAIDLCGGDARAALRATLIANAFLQNEVERLAATVSSGFARGRVRRRTGKAAVAEKKAG